MYLLIIVRRSFYILTRKIIFSNNWLNSRCSVINNVGSSSSFFSRVTQFVVRSRLRIYAKGSCLDCTFIFYTGTIMVSNSANTPSCHLD